MTIFVRSTKSAVISALTQRVFSLERRNTSLLNRFVHAKYFFLKSTYGVRGDGLL